MSLVLKYYHNRYNTGTCNFLRGKKKRSTGSAMQNPTTTESQTTLSGTSCRFTLYHTEENGNAPSLEKAYAILNLEKYEEKKSYHKNNIVKPFRLLIIYLLFCLFSRGYTEEVQII